MQRVIRLAWAIVFRFMFYPALEESYEIISQFANLLEDVDPSDYIPLTKAIEQLPKVDQTQIVGMAKRYSNTNKPIPNSVPFALNPKPS